MQVVLVVAQDLHMSPGKLAAQCAHAAVGLYKLMARQRIPWLAAWEVGAVSRLSCWHMRKSFVCQLQLLAHCSFGHASAHHHLASAYEVSGTHGQHAHQPGTFKVLDSWPLMTDCPFRLLGIFSVHWLH